MDDRRDTGTDAHTGESVIADPAKQSFHAFPGTFLKGFAHKAHPDDEHAHARKEPDQALDELHGICR